MTGEVETDVVHLLPDGSAFFIAEIDPNAKPPDNPIYWNGYNKVVQDHRNGTVHHDLTNAARVERGLPVPWTPEICSEEVWGPYVP